MIIINADDFGRSVRETDAAVALVEQGRVTSVSSMVFMQDSERAAALAMQLNVDVGLHLNFCERWTGPRVPRSLAAQHESLVQFFSKSGYAFLLYNPMLRQAFRAVCEAEFDEFRRLYGRAPSHIDGHHHLHLCANMVLDQLIPRGFRVRRNFTFAQGEKGLLNRAYRGFVDACLGRHYSLTDYFFSLEHCLSGKGRTLRQVADLGKAAAVEIMTHPMNTTEFDYLSGQRYLDVLGRVRKGTYAQLCRNSVERPLLWTLVASICECNLL
jgi:chitin disaccharide deacetylase